jgi:hypothetical protein
VITYEQRMTATLIESISSHYSAIEAFRKTLVSQLADALDGEVNFDFTWLHVKEWKLKDGDGYLIGARVEIGDGCSSPAITVWRDVHPDYVFVLSDRENGDHPEGFVAVFRAANEKKDAQ